MKITYEDVANLTGQLPHIYVGVTEAEFNAIGVAVYKTHIGETICVASTMELPELLAKAVFPQEQAPEEQA